MILLAGNVCYARHSRNVLIKLRFLTDHGYVNAQAADLDLCRLCISYLAFPCLMVAPDDEDSKALIECGSYIFANYAIRHWSEHLTDVMAYGDQLANTEKGQLWEILERFLNAQFDQSFPRRFAIKSIKDEFSNWNQEALFDQLVEAVTVHRLQRDPQLRKAQKDLPYIKSNLLVGQKYLDMRQEILRTGNLHGMYGQAMYYCYRLDCERFSNGFVNRQEQREHEDKHTSISCPAEGCLASFRGSKMDKDLSKHIHEVHDRKDDSFRPIGRPKTFSEWVCELIQCVNTHKLREVLDSADSGPFLFFDDSTGRYYRDQSKDHIAKQAWKTAIANPNEEILQLLIARTIFKSTYAQGWILFRTSCTGNKDLVQRFLDDKYDSGRENRMRPELNRAIKAAMASNYVEIVDMLLGRAMAVERERPSKDRLRAYCVTAVQSGQLAMLKLLSSKFGCKPYQTARVNMKSALLGLDWRSEFAFWNKCSPFCYAVKCGEIEIVKHLLEKATTQELTGLFRREPRLDLVLLAASNGNGEMVKVLDCDNLRRKDIEDALLRASFYNMIRAGNLKMANETIARACAMEEIPDHSGHTLLMHAAFGGLHSIVRALVKGGANMTRVTERYGDIRFTWPQNAAALAREGGHAELAQRLVEMLEAIKTTDRNKKKARTYEAENEEEFAGQSSKKVKISPEVIILD